MTRRRQVTVENLLITLRNLERWARIVRGALKSLGPETLIPPMTAHGDFWVIFPRPMRPQDICRPDWGRSVRRAKAGGRRVRVKNLMITLENIEYWIRTVRQVLKLLGAGTPVTSSARLVRLLQGPPRRAVGVC